MNKLKKILATTIACATIVGASFSTCLAADTGIVGQKSWWFGVKHGDCNADGEINLADYIQLVRYITWEDGYWLTPHPYCDCNGDVWVDSNDLPVLWNYITTH